jgi:hypothetical protein
MKYLLAIFIFILPTLALADQAVITQRKAASTYAYVIDVEDSKSCLKVVLNISNLKQHSNYFEATNGYYYEIDFICISENGEVTNNGTLYQLPFTLGKQKNTMCLRYGKFSGHYLTDECKETGFKTRAVLLQNETVNEYISRITED